MTTTYQEQQEISEVSQVPVSPVPVLSVPASPALVSQTLASQASALTQNPVSEEVGGLTDFLYLIDKLPIEHRADFYRSLHRLVEDFERRQQILGYVQESLSQMNLDLKYLIFDLEATRRERDEYRRQLEFLTGND